MLILMRKNKSIMIICPIIVILLTISLTGCVFRYGENIYEYSNFECYVDENTILDVSNINGQIEINGWENDTISFHFIKKTNERYGEDEFEKVEVNIDEIGNKIVVETVYLENTNHVSVSMKINVPNHVIIGSVNTHNGGLYLSNLKGDIEADTKNGPIDINNVDGFVKANVNNGPITVTVKPHPTNSNIGLIGIIPFDYYQPKLELLPKQFSYHIFITGYWMNTILISVALINMLPVYPLDGGRIVESLLQMSKIKRRYKIKLIISGIFATILIANFALSIIRYGLGKI